MVIVDVQIAVAPNLQVDPAMLGEEVEHVIQKSDPRIVVVRPRTVEVDVDPYIGFGRGAVDGCGARRRRSHHEAESVA
jgi:hypothetical protein